MNLHPRVIDLAALLELAAATGYQRFDSLLCLAELIRLYQPRAPLELGAAYGASTCFMARELPAGVQLTTIDDFTLKLPAGPVTEERLRANLVRFGVESRVRVLRGDTRKAGELIDIAPDFVFFDASHHNVDLLAEYLSLAPRLARGALLVIDDASVAPLAVAEIGRDRPHLYLDVHYGLALIQAD